MRMMNKQSQLSHGNTFHENLRFDGTSKYASRGNNNAHNNPSTIYNSTGVNNKTISTAANTNNFSLMSQKFKNQMRQQN